MLMNARITDRRGYAYDGEAEARRRQAEEELSRIELSVAKSKSRFVRGFSRHLPGEATTIFERLARAFEIRESSGNAVLAYDGGGVPTAFGPKTPTDRAIDAGRLISRCERVVVAEVHPYHVGAWRLITDALTQDFGPDRAGHHYTVVVKRDRLTADGSRKRAIRIIQRCGEALLSEFRGCNSGKTDAAL